MKTTIDKAGRVVIPASVRDRMGFVPGTELEVEVDELGVRLVRTAPEPDVVWEKNRWVVRAKGVAPAIDIPDLVDEERSRWPL
jgi:AbrB family looped-hinge helix DNA binding protein